MKKSTTNKDYSKEEIKEAKKVAKWYYKNLYNGEKEPKPSNMDTQKALAISEHSERYLLGLQYF